MKKCWFIRLLKFLALIVPIVCTVLFCQQHLFYFSDGNIERLQDFYREEEDSLDVVVMGASDVFTGFAPAYAYSLGEFTSYVYGFDSNPGSLYLAELKEVLSRQDPELLLIEVHGFIYDDDRQSGEAQLRHFLTGTPASANRMETLLKHPYEDKLSCLFPFFKYHGNWQMSFEEMAEAYEKSLNHPVGPSFFKGMATRNQADTREVVYEIIDDRSSRDLSPLGAYHLQELLDYCRDEQLDNVVFVRFPHKLVEEEQYQRFLRINRIEEIIREAGFPYLDLERMGDDICLDYFYDFYNPDHLNNYGQMKLTEYLTDWILYEYGLTPREQTAQNLANWEKSVIYNEALIEIAAEWMEEDLVAWLYEEPYLMSVLEDRIQSWEE